MSTAAAHATAAAGAPAVDPLAARPIDISVYEICRGSVRRGTVRTGLPYGASSNLRYAAAPRLAHAETTLAALSAVAQRCAPWVRVVAGPRLWARVREGEDVFAYRELRRAPDGSLWHTLGGQAWCRPHVPAGAAELAYVAACCGTNYAVGNLHHELWHILEYWLAPSDLAAVDRAARRGVALPGEYLSSPVERRARLYEAWACSCDEGWRPPSVGRPLRRLDRVLDYVYSGRMARDVARRGGTRPQGGGVRRAAWAALRAAVAWPLPVMWVAALGWSAVRWRWG